MPTSSRITIEQFNTMAAEQLPFMRYIDMRIEKLATDEVILIGHCDDTTLRPGGTVAGPVLMGLADVAFYALVLANVGMVALAVTTNLNINFLRKPGPGDLYCRARVLKMGKRLAICEASIYCSGEDPQQPAAHATGTYSLPPR